MNNLVLVLKFIDILLLSIFHLEAVRKVIIDKSDKSEVVFNLINLLLLLIITFYLPVLTHFMFYVTKINPVHFIS